MCFENGDPTHHQKATKAKKLNQALMAFFSDCATQQNLCFIIKIKIVK
jgi:hypothetical protein